MPQKYLYEYAVIRVVPVVEREEFVNVGIVMLCKRERKVWVRLRIHDQKILALAPEADLDEIRQNLDGFRRIAAGEKSAGPIAGMDATERFRWLTAVRSSTIQTSRPHPGTSDDLEKTLDNVMDEMVG